MKPPINPVKYIPPQLPPMVRRVRLFDLMDAMRHRPITVISGQPAQGKTSLVANYLSHHRLPAAWMHLDGQDGEVANFYPLLVCALMQATNVELNDFLEYRHIVLGTADDQARIADPLTQLWQRLPVDLVLVIDGLEKLAATSQAQALIRQMADLAHQRVRLILISRQAPLLKLQQSIVRQQATVLGNDVLAFTWQEISAYFKTMHALSLSKADAQRIRQITDGWTGGLVLLSQALQRQPGNRQHRFLAEQLPARLTGETMPYFSEEIFNSLDAPLQLFLIKAALLDVVDPALPFDADETGDTGLLMQQLVHQNLFIQVIHDEHHRPLYRFNQLFHDFLRSIRPLHMSDDQRAAFYLAIADHYWKENQVATAIDYFVKARSFDKAAAGIKKIGIDWMVRGRYKDLATAIKALPGAMVSRDPWLLMLLTLSRRISGGARNIDDFQTALKGLQNSRDIRGQMFALAFLIEAHIFSGNDTAACRHRILQAEQLLNENSHTPYFAYAKTMLWLQVGFGCITGGLDLARGLSACRKAWLLARQIKDSALMANIAIVTALGYATAGEFQRADEALSTIGPFMDSVGMTEYRLLKTLINIKLPLRRGDLDAAAQRLDAIGKEIESHGMLFLYPVYLDIRGTLEIYRGNFTAARKTCRHLLDVAMFSSNSIYLGLAHRLNALKLYTQQKFADAHVAIDRAETAFGAEHSTLHLMRARQLKGLIALRLGQYHQAAALFEQVLAYFKETDNRQSVTETHLAYGLLAVSPAYQDPAFYHMQTGLAMRTKRQPAQFVHLSPRDLAQIEQWAARLHDGRPADFGQDGTGNPAPFARGNPGGIQAAMEPSGWAAWRGGDSPGMLVIRTFGRFQVSIGDRVPIGPGQWGGRLPKLLLKSIVVHGLVDIPKDILIDDLWPESKPTAGHRNFKVTLHRLRKTLEPSLGKNKKSAYIQLKDGRVTLNQSRCRVDMQEFLHLCKDIKRLAISDESSRILEPGRRVMAVYQGDFLPEEPYAPWAEMKRWALKEAYLSVLMQMAKVYQRHKQIDKAVACCQAAIAADPCIEEASQRLINLYASSNRRGEAVKVYKQLYRTLKDELGVKPDQATTSLFRMLVQP